MSPVIRAAGSADFLALVPHLLGYAPAHSLVLVPFAGNRTLGAMRLDLPPDDDVVDAVASTFIGLVCKVTHADAVAVVTYAAADIAHGMLPHERLLAALLDRAELCGLRVSDALCVAPNGWASYLDPPVDGPRPLDEIPHDDPSFADFPPLAAGPGGAALPEVDLAWKERVGRALARLEPADPDAPVEGAFSPYDGIEAMPAFFQDVLEPEPDLLTPECVALLLWALARPGVRDVALIGWAYGEAQGERALDAQVRWAEGEPYPDSLARLMWGDGPAPDPDRLRDALAVLRHVAASAPRASRPGPLALAAWFSWALGMSSRGAAYADAALAIDPDHGLAQILRAFIGSSHLPDWAFRREPAAGPVDRLVDSAGRERLGGPGPTRRPAKNGGSRRSSRKRR